MDIVERLRHDLRGAKRAQIEALADSIGIPRGTFRKIVSGQTPNPQWDNVKKILAHYERLPAILTELPQAAAHEPQRGQMRG